jgi:hypothetical protein
MFPTVLIKADLLDAQQTNQKVAFTYNTRDRQGKIEKLTDTLVTLELDNDRDGKKYKSFRFDRMQSLVLKLAATT